MQSSHPAIIGSTHPPTPGRKQPHSRQPPRAIRILLADDHPAVLDLLAYFFVHMRRFKVVGKEENGPKAIHCATLERPDIVLLGLSRSPAAGIKSMEQLIRVCPQAKIIAFSATEEESVVSSLLRAGARGYVSKDSGSLELLRGIESVQRGEIFISQRILRRMATNGLGVGCSNAVRREDGLTKSEVEVVGCLADGLGSKQIASRMRMSVRTIEKYRDSIKAKLRIRSVAEITKFAIRTGITELG